MVILCMIQRLLSYEIRPMIKVKCPQRRNCDTKFNPLPPPSPRHPICTVCRPFSRYYRGVYTQTERWLMERGNKAAGVTSITSLEQNFPRSGNNSKYRGIGPYPGFSGLLRSGQYAASNGHFPTPVIREIVPTTFSLVFLFPLLIFSRCHRIDLLFLVFIIVLIDDTCSKRLIVKQILYNSYL